MKKLLQAAAFLLLLSTVTAHLSTASAQGTAFTYQGQLDSGGAPANGSFDITFTLFTNSSGGLALVGPVTNSAVSVTNGLFTTIVNFGNAFTGTSNWLELAVRTNGAASFSPPLTPRQQLTPTPYAVFAETANAAGLTGTLSGNGSGLTNLTAANLTGPVTTANLPTDAALLDASQTFSGINNFSSSVGIGTSSPSTQLDIVGSGQSDDARLLVESTGGTFGPQLRLKRDGSGGDEWVFVTDGTVNGPVNALQIVQSSSGTPRFMIATNGNVGIGTTTPNMPLAVIGNLFFGQERPNTTFNQIGDTLYLGAENKYLGNTLLSPVAGTTDWINLMGNPVAGGGIMFGLSGPTTTDPHANITPLMVIRPNGNVGIGTTSPSAQLTISNSSNPSVTIIGSSGKGELDFGIASFGGAFSASANANDAVIRQSGLGKLYLQTGIGAAAVTITTNNNVGIATATPNSDSQLQVKGMVRMGSETGTSEAPNAPIMVRRINSTSSATGQIVARSTTGFGGDSMTLERDGTSGGLILKVTGTVGGSPQIVGFGITASGTTLNVFQNSINGLGNNTTTQIFTDAQKVGYCRLSFGDSLNLGNMTTVELMRDVDTSLDNDAKWIGTVTSTLNQ